MTDALFKSAATRDGEDERGSKKKTGKSHQKGLSCLLNDLISFARWLANHI